MTILLVGEHSAVLRDIQQALSTVPGWSTRFEQSPEAAGAAIAGGRADLAVVRIRGTVAADMKFARELYQRWQAPVMYVLSDHGEDAWAGLRDTHPLAWISEPLDDAELRVNVEIATRKVAEERQLREDVRRAGEVAGLMAGKHASLAEHLARISTLVRTVPQADGGRTGIDARDPLAALTARERQIVQMLCEGGRVASIAGELGIRAGTVRNHLSAAFRKLGVRSQGQLISLLRRSRAHSASTLQRP